MESASTEEKILLAAREVFVERGMYGARMQDIADKAGINKALLHYYYRSKEKLFEAVFKLVFGQFISNVKGILKTDTDLKQKLCIIVDLFLDLFATNPFVPIFLITEINREPSAVKDFILAKDFPELILSHINEALSENQIHFEDFKMVFVDILSMVIFPVLAKPLFTTLLFNSDQNEYRSFIEKRRVHIKNILEIQLTALKNKN